MGKILQPHIINSELSLSSHGMGKEMNMNIILKFQYNSTWSKTFEISSYSTTLSSQKNDTLSL